MDFKYEFGEVKEKTNETGKKETTVVKSIPELYIQFRDSFFYALKSHKIPIKIGNKKEANSGSIKINPSSQYIVYITSVEVIISDNKDNLLYRIEIQNTPKFYWPFVITDLNELAEFLADKIAPLIKK